MSTLRETLDWLWNHVFLLEWLFRIVLSAVVIYRRRPVPVTLAWLFLIMFLPIVGAFLYLLIGENRLGSRRLAEYEQITTQVEPLIVAHWWEKGLTCKRAAEGTAFENIADYALAVGGLPPLLGNRLELMNDTDEYLRRMIADIESATSHCHMEYYIWQSGGKAEKVTDALIAAAARGVEVKVLVDGSGSRDFLRGQMFQRMCKGGVNVLECLPVNFLRLAVARIDLRTHRKIAVIDGRIAYTGSQNLTDTTFHYRKRKHFGPWIDASLRVEGPAVQALAMIFLRDWAMETDEEVRLDSRYLPEVAPFEGGSIVQVVPTGPGPDAPAMREAILTMIYAARQELILTTPYYVPDEPTQSAIVAAARRGVKVTMVVPAVTDTILVGLAARSHYEDLMVAGVRLMQFRKGLLHAKTISADGRVAMIGSANIDTRSFWLNFEVTVFVYDEPFIREIIALQQSYIAVSDATDLTQWRSRGRLRHAAESLGRLFGPLL